MLMRENASLLIFQITEKPSNLRPFVVVIQRNTRWHHSTKSPHLLEPLGIAHPPSLGQPLNQTNKKCFYQFHFSLQPLHLFTEHLLCPQAYAAHGADYEGVKRISSLKEHEEKPNMHAPHTKRFQNSPRQDVISTDSKRSRHTIHCNLTHLTSWCLPTAPCHVEFLNSSYVCPFQLLEIHKR